MADRVWLYFCPRCFGEDCGGVSARIRFTGTRRTGPISCTNRPMSQATPKASNHHWISCSARRRIRRSWSGSSRRRSPDPGAHQSEPRITAGSGSSGSPPGAGSAGRPSTAGRQLPGRVPLLVGPCLHRACGRGTTRLSRTATGVLRDDFRLGGSGEARPGRELGQAVDPCFAAGQYHGVVGTLLHLEMCGA
ncbi:hypothetical protein E9229_001299 [Paeniglutamicibacter cryotolerans]|uniref:Uncharacterized protein n=1 Tax=Paeniglutamicibacter cryotolerans TaxID=670079 RepID=A0A839QFP9_9MICC|nr:hypothetical protein [Paeniglutamicibacter cryotolerans]